MSWQDEMKVAAARLAFGNPRDTDGSPADINPATISVTSSYEEGSGYSEYTFESNYLSINVRFGPRSKHYENEAASKFLVDLMRSE